MSERLECEPTIEVLYKSTYLYLHILPLIKVDWFLILSPGFGANTGASDARHSKPRPAPHCCHVANLMT